MRDLHPQTHTLFIQGAIPYLQAGIYAVLGEKSRAVDLLRHSIEQGRLFSEWNITFDRNFVSLKGDPPFEELIKPKEILLD